MIHFILFSLIGAGSPDQIPSVEISEGASKVIEAPAALQALEMGEVKLAKNSSLILPSFRSIRIQHLIAEEGARIRFAANASGGSGENSASGKNSENARFFLGKVEGHIVIEAKGGDGGDGQNGTNGQNGRDGGPGPDGRTLLFGWVYIGDGGDGENGAHGEHGGDGENGGNGGNGGKILLLYKEKTLDSKIIVDVSAGRAGKAGLAGMGGLGGNGGAGGQGVNRGHQGAMGVSGLSGFPGKPGEPGQPGEALVYQVNDELFECLFRLDLFNSAEDLREEDFDQCREITSSEDLNSPIVVASNHKILDIPLSAEKIMWVQADGESGVSAPSAKFFGTRPYDGSSGAAGGDITILVRDIPESTVITARGGMGGDAGNGANGKRGLDGKDGRDFGFKRKAEPGEDGERGGNGGAGSNGGQGGKGGKIRIVRVKQNAEDIDDSWMNFFETDVSSGTGGKNGVGGIAGRGGQGGRGGKIPGVDGDQVEKRAPDGKPGPSGTNGKEGKKGERGEDGVVEFYEADTYAAWVVEDFKSALKW
ncbi:MAG: collagen-like protein [Deltaproteobacteria bacterium]|nr:collagen-like protein [Deltaproteobacteria bacterium]